MSLYISKTRTSGRSSLIGMLFWGVGVALLTTIVQGLVALVFDVGLLYPMMGYTIGSIIRLRAPEDEGALQQIIAIGLTYLAVALTPVIPFAVAVNFNGARIVNSAVGGVFAFVPLMGRAGPIGILNVALLLLGLRQAWVQSRHPQHLITTPNVG